MTNIELEITFKKYQFSRVKLVGNQAVAYTNSHWTGKKVSIIPLPIYINDRVVEASYDESTHQYKLNTHTTQIIQRKVVKGSNIGRLNLPKDFVGLDVLIIPTPQYDDF